jgi:hypothetical protein
MKRVSITEELAYGTALDRLTGAEKPAPVPKKSPPKPSPPSNVPMIKLSVFLHREEDAYLENLASTAKFSGGKKLSKTKLIEAMVRAFRTSQLDVRGVKTDDELLKRVITQLRQ